MSADSNSEPRITSDVGPFALVPEWLLDLDLSDRAVRLYAVLSRYADSGGYCWPSRRTLAARLGRSTDALDRAMRELVDAGIVEVTPRYDPAGDRTSNGYLIRRAQPAAEQTGSRHSAATGGRERAATGGRGTAAVRRASRNDSQEESSDAVPASAAQRPRDEVWDAVMAVCGVDAAQVTSSSRGAYNRAVADLKAVGATPEEIAARAWVFRQRWPNASLTPTSLARRWAELDPDRQHGTERPRTSTEQQTLARLVDAWEGGDA